MDDPSLGVYPTSIHRKTNKQSSLASDHLEKKMEDSKTHFEPKVNAIKDQMEDANARRKAKLQKRIDSLTQEYTVRTAKLKQASKLVGEAFEIRKKEGELA